MRRSARLVCDGTALRPVPDAEPQTGTASKAQEAHYFTRRITPRSLELRRLLPGRGPRWLLISIDDRRRLNAGADSAARLPERLRRLCTNWCRSPPGSTVARE